ncbi:MAG: hypothetical protein K2P51_02915 [Rhabdochlamydiaceae bacterium]|nr:hypothetical protein [Rhabdochlamydiaceae bacterium]
MKTIILRFFIENWPRKLVALILAIITWLVVNQTLTTTRNLSNIPVRILNIPTGKTIEGLQPNGRLAKKITLTLVGNKTILDELTSYDLEVVLDAADKPEEWIASISKKNLVSLNPEIDISKGISRVYHPNLLVRMAKLVTEQIPVIITQPVGEAPRGYQFLDVWPYRLTLTVSGPEELIKRLKLKEQRITFNLNDINKAQLDALASNSNTGRTEVISYFVPDQWKQINIPLLSDTPLEIDDAQAKALRIDFVRCNLIPIEKPIPVTLFYPDKYLDTLNPSTLSIAPGNSLKSVHGINLITTPLYANGIDRLFLETVEDMLQIVIIAAPPSERNLLEWSIEFINPRQLEDHYVSSLMSDVSDEDIRLLQPALRQEYLRNRFRSYMNRFQLFNADDTTFDLALFIKDGKVEIHETSQEASTAALSNL